jgi:hypothetical protein
MWGTLSIVNDAAFGGAYDALTEAVKARALDQARHVPWRRLAEAVDEANNWEVFNLWLRAVADASGRIPPAVERELETRIPGLLAQHHSEIQTASMRGALASWLWNLVGTWVTVNLFLEPKLQGWLDAIPFFLSKSLPYMKAWAHWEQVSKEWRINPPAEWPTFDQWQNDIAAVTDLPNADTAAQAALNAVCSVSAGRWERILSMFLDLIAFSHWMQLVLDSEGPSSRLVLDSIRSRYQGFRFSTSDLSSTEAVGQLNIWVIQREIGGDRDDLLEALSWHAQRHPRYYAVDSYALHCRDAWLTYRPDPLPCLSDWQKAADTHTC